MASGLIFSVSTFSLFPRLTFFFKVNVLAGLIAFYL